MGVNRKIEGFEARKQSNLKHLRTHLKLKLKVNFENSLYRVEDYISLLLLHGGVVE